MAGRTTVNATKSHPMLPRLLAIVALIAAVIALVLALSAGGESSQEPGNQQARNPANTNTQPENKVKRPKVYTVKEGDSLGAIAERFGVPQQRIEKLNPELEDPQNLPIGAKIKLR